MSTRPRPKRAKPWRKHDLYEGDVLTRSNEHATTTIIGLQYGHALTVTVAPIPYPGQPLRREWVQLQVKLHDAQGEPLGSSMFLGHRMSQLAWAFLHTRTGEMTQTHPYHDDDADA